MLELDVTIEESWDEMNNEFVYTTEKLQLEHSLVSLSKWESRVEKPFLTSEKTIEESTSYVLDMAISPNVRPDIVRFLTEVHVKQIQDYIGAKMSATTIRETQQRPNREVITAELIYYWMIALQIPMECQYWHLNKLLTLVRVCNIKNTPAKKMTPQQIAKQNRELNAQRRAQYHTRG